MDFAQLEIEPARAGDGIIASTATPSLMPPCRANPQIQATSHTQPRIGLNNYPSRPLRFANITPPTPNSKSVAGSGILIRVTSPVV